MRLSFRFIGPALTLLAASPAVLYGKEEAPRRLHAHPEQELPAEAGPFWLAAAEAFKDGVVREGWRIGDGRAATLSESWELGWPFLDEVDDLEDCWIAPQRAASIRSLVTMPVRSVYLPGDFTGWVAASEAVVVGTVVGLLPGFDVNGRSHTLAVLEEVEHLYPSSDYAYTVRYVILPLARFAAGGRLFCYPAYISLEYHPAVGDRLLIAAGPPADSESLALTVPAMSRIVRVEADETLTTFGRSDYYPVEFSSDFPRTLEEARSRAWAIWRSGLVDFAASRGLKDFTQAWLQLEQERGNLKARDCDLDRSQLIPNGSGWAITAACPPVLHEGDEALGQHPEVKSQ